LKTPAKEESPDDHKQVQSESDKKQGEQ